MITKLWTSPIPCIFRTLPPPRRRNQKTRSADEGESRNRSPQVAAPRQGISVLLRRLPRQVPGRSRRDPVIPAESHAHADAIWLGDSRRQQSRAAGAHSSADCAQPDQPGAVRRRHAGLRLSHVSRGSPDRARPLPQVWHGARSRISSPSCNHAPSTPARCTRKSSDRSPGTVQFAAWRLSRER